MSESRIFLTGGSGFLGSRIAVLAAGQGYEVTATHLTNPVPDMPGIKPLKLNLAGSVDKIAEVLARLQPGVVLHTAYNMSDAEPNITATRNLARACAKLEPRPYFLYTSTDLVFDGKQGMYTEDDEPAPVIEYGRQKLEAEQVLRDAFPEAAITRPSLIYDLERLPRHLSFAVGAIGQGRTFNFFIDEYRCPVLADELAGAILELSRRKLGGTWHMAGSERVDRWWFGIRLLKSFGYSTELARRGRSAELAGDRPADCSLDCTKLQRELNIRLSGAKQVLGEIRMEEQ